MTVIKVFKTSIFAFIILLAAFKAGAEATDDKIEILDSNGQPVASESTAETLQVPKMLAESVQTNVTRPEATESKPYRNLPTNRVDRVRHPSTIDEDE